MGLEKEKLIINNWMLIPVGNMARPFCNRTSLRWEDVISVAEYNHPTFGDNIERTAITLRQAPNASYLAEGNWEYFDKLWDDYKKYRNSLVFIAKSN